MNAAPVWRVGHWATGASSLAGVTLAASLLAACHREARPDAGPRPVASIRDIMLYEVDPAADALWASVSTTLTATGTEERRPRTSAEWEAVQRQALRLAEAPNLLVVPGRRVAHGGQALDDADAPGNQTAEQIDRQIAADPDRFAHLAAELQRAALQAGAAARARDVARLLDAGAVIDRACEACHQTYWYPGQAALLRRQAVR